MSHGNELTQGTLFDRDEYKVIKSISEYPLKPAVKEEEIIVAVYEGGIVSRLQPYLETEPHLLPSFESINAFAFEGTDIIGYYDPNDGIRWSDSDFQATHTHLYKEQLARQGGPLCIIQQQDLRGLDISDDHPNAKLSVTIPPAFPIDVDNKELKKVGMTNVDLSEPTGRPLQALSAADTTIRWLQMIASMVAEYNPDLTFNFMRMGKDYHIKIDLKNFTNIIDAMDKFFKEN